MATAAKRLQDMPPKGGYPPFVYKRVPAKQIFGGEELCYVDLAIVLVLFCSYVIFRLCSLYLSVLFDINWVL